MSNDNYKTYLVYYTVDNLYMDIVDAPSPEAAARAVNALHRNKPGIPGVKVGYHECQDEALVKYEVYESNTKAGEVRDEPYVFGEEELDD